MNKRRKKILILAGAAAHSKVVRAAREMGIVTAVADYLPLERSPAKQLADIPLQYDIYDVDGLAAWCRENLVDGVINFCIDPAQVPAQQIAERAGLPTFGTAEQVCALTNKQVFKALCAESGVATIQSYSEEDVRAGNVRYPILVKPVISRGSRGATVCWGPEDFARAVATAREASSDAEHGCLIERYMTPNVCQDLTISYLVRDGVPTLVSVGDRHSGRIEDNLDRQLVCTIQPSRHAAAFLEREDGKLKGLIRRLGIRNGPVFFQGFWDGEVVRLYDPGLRYPGNEYEQMLARATGVDLMKSLISYCVGGEVDDFGGKIYGCHDLGGKACLQYMVNVGPGTIAAFEGLDEIAAHPCVVDVTQKRFVGETIEDTGDVRHRAAEISILCERDCGRMAEIVRFVQRHLNVRDTKGRNQLISPFSVDLMNELYSHWKEPVQWTPNA